MSHRVAGIDVHLMDGFALSCAGEPLTRPLPAQRLVAFLALRAKPLQRVYVAGMLWPDVSEQRALASLRSALWRANDAQLPLVRACDSRLALDEQVRIDIQDVGVVSATTRRSAGTSSTAAATTVARR